MFPLQEWVSLSAPSSGRMPCFKCPRAGWANALAFARLSLRTSCCGRCSRVCWGLFQASRRSLRFDSCGVSWLLAPGAWLLLLVDVVLGVEDVELAGRRDDARIGDHLLHLQSRVVVHHDGRLVGSPARLGGELECSFHCRAARIAELCPLHRERTFSFRFAGSAGPDRPRAMAANPGSAATAQRRSGPASPANRRLKVPSRCSGHSSAIRAAPQ